MLQNALDLKTPALEQTSSEGDSVIPAWASAALNALQANGISLSEAPLTRNQAADTLYRCVQLKRTGLGIFTE